MTSVALWKVWGGGVPVPGCLSSLTSVGEVTLMSGAAAASNRLMIFSAFISFDGVTFGGGGTAGFS